MKPITDFDSKYFQPEEILSPGSIKLWEEKGLLILNPEAFSRLNAFREFVGAQMVVNKLGSPHRGTRTHAENEQIKGAAKFSAHLLGMAFDVTVPGMSIQTLAAKAKDSGLWTGIGIYSTWVHLDCAWRATNSFIIWHGDH